MSLIVDGEAEVDGDGVVVQADVGSAAPFRSSDASSPTQAGAMSRPKADSNAA